MIYICCFVQKDYINLNYRNACGNHLRSLKGKFCIISIGEHTRNLFRGRKFDQRRAKCVHGNMALPCILNKQLLLLAQSSKPILYFKLYATGLLKPFSQDTK